MNTAQYAELFLTESREHVSAINHSLLELERANGEGGSDAVSSIFRSVHTIKGMSATMGYTPVATLSHEMETLLDAMRRGTRQADPELMQLLFRSADVLEQCIEGAVHDQPAPPELDVVVRELKAESTSVPARRASVAMAAPTTEDWPAGAPAGAGLLVRWPR